MKKILLFVSVLSCLLSLQLFGTDVALLQRNLQAAASPFNYPLNVAFYPSKNPNASVTVCFHGYGGDYKIGQVMRQCVDEHVVSFNFPDAGIVDWPNSISKTSYGTINELLPAIYVVKQCLTSCNSKEINLYGFSCGGGAVVNVLAVLNRNDYDAELSSIGITKDDKIAILQAIQKGYVIIDCPLKSIEEIMDVRGYNPSHSAMANAYTVNRLRPIDSLIDLQGLSLKVLLNIQDPDEAVTNRDDGLYISRLESANKKGKTVVIISRNEGHVAYHPDLWKAYRQMKLDTR